MSLIQATITLLLTGMFCSAFPLCWLLTLNYANIMSWVQPFYRNKSRSCLYLNAASGNDNQVPQWKCHPPKHQMLSQAPQQKRTTSTKSRRTKGAFLRTHKWQQAPTTSTQASKRQWYRRSHCQEPTQGQLKWRRRRKPLTSTPYN